VRELAFGLEDGVGEPAGLVGGGVGDEDEAAFAEDEGEAVAASGGEFACVEVAAHGPGVLGAVDPCVGRPAFAAVGASAPGPAHEVGFAGAFVVGDDGVAGADGDGVGVWRVVVFDGDGGGARREVVEHGGWLGEVVRQRSAAAAAAAVRLARLSSRRASRRARRVSSSEPGT